MGRALYTYVGNDPLDRTDPSGNCIEDLCIVEGLIAFALANAPEITAGAVVAAEVASGVPSPTSMAESAVGNVARTAVNEVKAAQLAKNVAQGAKGEAQVAVKLGDKVAGQRVTLEATTRERSVADIVTKDKGVVEVKTGNAKLSAGQKAVKADIDAGRQEIGRAHV